MTTSAITQGSRIRQSNLGVKIHDVKDPGSIWARSNRCCLRFSH